MERVVDGWMVGVKVDGGESGRRVDGGVSGGMWMVRRVVDGWWEWRVDGGKSGGRVDDGRGGVDVGSGGWIIGVEG